MLTISNDHEHAAVRNKKDMSSIESPWSQMILNDLERSLQMFEAFIIQS